MQPIRRAFCIATAIFALATAASARESDDIVNPAIDMEGYLATAFAAAAHRQSHRVSEGDFLRSEERRVGKEC